MTLRNLRLRALGAIVLGSLALTACGTAAAPAGSNQSSGAPTVSLATAPGGETYLADGSGRALYLFMNDSGGKSSCAGSCAQFWPPLSGSATASSGLSGQLTMITRDDGRSQAVFNGHPLYYFKNDAASGDTKGEGLNQDGGLWYLLDGSGKAITALSAGSDGGGMGY